MPRLTVAQALVAFLRAQRTERDGVRRPAIGGMFGIFGHGNVCALSAALSEPDAGLPFHQPKHEQAMVHTALGYAKAQRRLATLACTASIGPGATNLVTGAATATANRLPVLLLPADTFASRRQGPVLQQLQHPTCHDWTVNDCLRPVSRFFDRINRPEQLLDAAPEAMRVLFDPAETGAVTLALHQDVQGEAWDVPDAFLAERVWRVPRPEPEEAALHDAVALIRAAQRPLLIAGGGVHHSGAEAALGAFSAATGVPVAETSAGKGTGAGPVIGSRDLSLGGIGVNGTRAANELAARADLVVCVGTRLTDFTTGSRSLFRDPGVRFLAVNVSAADAHAMGAVPVVADARVALERLTGALRGWSVPDAHRRAVREARERWDAAVAADLAPRDGERMTQGQVLRELNAAARAGDWVVAAAGSPPGDLLKLWEPPAGSRAHIEFGFSCMGHELPAALGIRMADSAAGEVLAVIGDGTFLMSPTELVTAVQEGLKVTVVVLVNGGYQSIHGLQLSTVGRSFGNEFRRRRDGDATGGEANGDAANGDAANGDAANGDAVAGARSGDAAGDAPEHTATGAPDGPVVEIDHAALARALGARAWSVETLAELRDALAEARGHDGPALLACHVEPRRAVLDSGCWWDLGVAEVSATPETRERAAAHAAGAADQRYHG